MRCPRCAHANGDRAHFCSNCGANLEHRCPACAEPYEEGDNFCSNCGTALSSVSVPADAPGGGALDDLARYLPDELLHKIEAARAGHAMRGERRTVTMLFADLEGSTAAAEHLDPEEWAEIVNGAFGRLIAPVYRYEGTLARLQGDAILAFFGAPIAHEDDPVRAARAGLDIVADLEPYAREVDARFGVPIAVRVGINTGLVVVGEVGSDLRVEYTALGDAINVAARMEQTAEPGTVQVTDETLGLLGDAFRSTPLGTVEVKGKTDPVPAHRLDAYGPTTDAPQASTPLVGRDTELQVLEDAVVRLDRGVGAIRTVIGEAGIGKSRLVTALRDRLSATRPVATTATADGSLAWLRGAARSYERSVPHGAFVDLLCRWWDRDRVTPDRCFARIADAYERATGDRDHDAAAILAHLVGVPVPDEQAQLIEALSAPVLHERRTSALADYLHAEAHQRPVVLVLDDLHWADDVSLALVERLMEVTEGAPLGLVLLLRANRDEPAWRLVEAAQREHAHRHDLVELDALEDADRLTLLDPLLVDVELDGDLRQAILERSNGNPLFVEELIRSLREDAHQRPSAPGTTLTRSQVVLPPSLTGLLTSRLDRLGDTLRHVAQVASIIGREFDLAALEATVGGQRHELDAQVRELIRRGVVEERGRDPTPRYAFRHPLIQETAYSTVLLRTRRELHGKVAAHLAEHDPEAVHEIAHHHVEAGDTAAAFPYLIASGQRATRSMALRDAIAAFTTALDARPDDADPDLVAAAYDGLGQAYAMVPDLTHTSATYQSLLDFGRQADRPAIQVAALNRLGFNTAALAGDFDGAMRYLGDARELAESVGDELGLAEYHQTACYVAAFRGELDQAVAHDDATARIGRQVGNETVRLTGLLRRTTNLLAAVRVEEARASYVEAREVAAEQSSDEVLAVLETNAAAPLALIRGDLPEALEVMRRALPTVDRYTSYYGATAHRWHAECAAHVGDVELALSAYAATERYGRSLQQLFAVAAGASGRARILAMSGVWGDLERLRARAVATIAENTGEFFSTSVWADLADADLAIGDLGAAERDLDEAVRSSSITAIWERPRLALIGARIALGRGDLGGVHAALDRAREFVAQRGVRIHEPELLVLDGAAAERDDRLDDAVTVLQAAASAATETGRVPLQIEAWCRLSAVRARQGLGAQARVLRERAEIAAGELAGAIVDTELRESFQRTQRARTSLLAGTG